MAEPISASPEFSASDLQWCRDQFPALRRSWQGTPLAFLDGPAGTQVPERVCEAMVGYLVECNANRGGQFPTARDSDARMDAAHAAAADLLGTSDPGTVAFGPNMTTLTFAFSRALARTWKAGDEILLSRMEHDANFTPWVMAARDAGVIVRFAGVNTEDGTLDLEDLRSKLSERTRLVAVGCASNAIGTRNPVETVCRWAREAGALSFLDAVHFAPHDLIDVTAWGCDFLACSAYKFFGPHLGLLWGRRELMESLEAYKLRTSPKGLPGKWMTGTPSHEAMAGTMAAIDYLADLGRRVTRRPELSRREALRQAFAAIVPYERRLARQLIEGLQSVRGGKVWGITSAARDAERMPTVAWTHETLPSVEVARTLGDQGICVWHGNYYALPLTECLGVEPHGMVRIGMVHYNSAEEVDRVVQALRKL